MDLPFPKNVVVFHGGTKMEDGVLKTSGGRVLTITAIGKKENSRKEDLSFIDEISEFFKGQQFRRDIAR